MFTPYLLSPLKDIYLGQMFALVRWCAQPITQQCRLKVKVTIEGLLHCHSAAGGYSCPSDCLVNLLKVSILLLYIMISLSKLIFLMNCDKLQYQLVSVLYKINRRRFFYCTKLKRFFFSLKFMWPFITGTSWICKGPSNGGLYMFPLRKHAYSNILKLSPPKTENFQIKKSDIFHISVLNIDYGTR